MKHQESVRYIEIGMLCFFVLLGVCIFIRPVGLGANSGISYYGAFMNTIIPYALGFLSMGMAVWFASLSMRPTNGMGRYIKLAFRVFALLLVGLLLTPHTTVGTLHKVFGSTLFATQLLLAIYLVINSKLNITNLILLLVAFSSGLASAFYLGTAQGYMIQSQVIFQIVIWWLYIRVLKYQAL